MSEEPRPRRRASDDRAGGRRADTAALAANSAERAAAAAQDAIVHAEVAAAGVAHQAAERIAGDRRGPPSNGAEPLSETRNSKGQIVPQLNESTGRRTPAEISAEPFIDAERASSEAPEPAEPGARARRPERPGGGTANGASPASGARAGGKSGAAQKSAPLDLSSLAGVIQGCHAVIAFQRSEPHWLLNDPDAARYSIALANALRHLPLKNAQKAVDYAAFAMVAFAIETPRAWSDERPARPKPARQRGTAPRGPAPGFPIHGTERSKGVAQPVALPAPPTGALAARSGGSNGSPGGNGQAGPEAAPSPFAAGPDGFGQADDDFEPAG